MSSDFPKSVVEGVPNGARIGIVAARFNQDIVNALLSGCLHRLEQLALKKIRMEVHHVPGAFELPVTAKLLIDAGKVDAVICLGCVIRGDTPHFDYVAGEAARGIQQVAIDTGVPVIFGVLTVENEQQAQDRIGGAQGHAGVRAAEAALEMIALRERIKPSTESS
ncbi:MAG: 6,7-dimethyl-8-ribityllumazine synthase [Anaerolineae bacterium]|nr:6,7-dimethyl-8-ribityllumazine synthase [Phycisphaerae bacterium]